MPKQAKLRKIDRADGRAAKWGISIPREGARPKRIFFETAAKRDGQFRALKNAERQDGRNVLSVSAGDVALLADLREILGPEVDPREAARYFVERKRPVAAVELRAARREFVKRQETRRLSRDSLDHYGLALNRLESFFGASRGLAEIESADLVRFLSGLGFGARSQENHRKYLKTFFRWCVERRFLLLNPMDHVGAIEVPETEPEFMGPSDARAFFVKAVELFPEMAPVLALSFFGGLRSTSIERLGRGDLDFDERGIRFRGSHHKTRRRFFVQGHPENLWAWLEPWRKVKTLPSWPKSSFIQARRRIYEEAGVAFPHNAGRHSFCTYHVALHGSADRTATLLTHRGSVSVLYDHYRGNATRAMAEAYFGIMPGGAG